MATIKDRIISKFGGVGIVARICGVTAGAVSQWKDRIPAKHHMALVMDAKSKGIDCDLSDFYEAHPKMASRD